MLIGVVIVKNKRLKEEDAEKAEQIARRCLERGVPLGRSGNVLCIAPPLTLTKDEAREKVDSLREVMEEASR